MEADGELLKAFWDLLHVPEDSRDQTWQERVAVGAMKAPLEPQDGDQLIQGPDGFRYLAVGFPRQTTFESLTLGDALNNLIESISGYAIIGPGSKPLFVLSHGDILSLKLYGRLLVKWDPPWDQPTPKDLYQHGGNAIIAEPNEEMLPKIVRNSLRQFLIHAGVPEPGVVLARIGPVSDIMFNVFAEDFEKESHFNWVTTGIIAFLPRHLRVRVVFMRGNADFPFDWYPL